MNVDEIVAGLREDRAKQIERIEKGRSARAEWNAQIKAATTELVRIDRLLRAAEGRKKGKVTEDGEPQ